MNRNYPEAALKTLGKFLGGIGKVLHTVFIANFGNTVIFCIVYGLFYLVGWVAYEISQLPAETLKREQVAVVDTVRPDMSVVDQEPWSRRNLDFTSNSASPVRLRPVTASASTPTATRSARPRYGRKSTQKTKTCLLVSGFKKHISRDERSNTNFTRHREPAVAVSV